jgi:hypothetical protein
MVKVTLKHVRTGLTGASGLALLHSATGCTVPATAEPVARSTAAIAVDAGAPGTLTLGWSIPSTAYPASFDVQGPVDEYVRTGDTMTFSLSAYQLWDILYPTTAEPQDPNRAAQLVPRFHVQFVAAGDVVGEAEVTVRKWNVAAPFAVNGVTGAFNVPPLTDTMLVELSIVDEGGDGGATSVELSTLDFASIPVFGGGYPVKHLLFDNDGATLRQRIIEGGTLLVTDQNDATIDFAVTDWRADEIVQRSLLDTQIGTEAGQGRFGDVTIPLYGQVQYEIAVGYSFGGAYWEEMPLTAAASPRVLDLAGRTAYQATLYPPTSNSTLSVYLHVKAYLVADYSAVTGSSVTEWYAQGARILLAEKWDNPNGTAFANYDFPVALAPETP